LDRGIGAAGALIIGILAPGETANVLRISAALLIVGGLVLMKLSTPD
jgi:quaternary ammonium compound-resistance protein SugE